MLAAKLNCRALIGVLLMACAMGGCRSEQDRLSNTPGRDIYGQKCLSCHGSDGNGSKVFPHALKYREVVQNQAQFLEVVREGVSGTVMPSWKSELNNEEIERVRQFLLSIK